METSRRSTNSLAEELLQEVQARASSQEGMERFVHVLLAGLPLPEADFVARLQSYVATKRAWYRNRRYWIRVIDDSIAQHPSTEKDCNLAALRDLDKRTAWWSEKDYVSEAQVKSARYRYKELEQELVNEIGPARVRELKRQQAALWGSPYIRFVH